MDEGIRLDLSQVGLIVGSGYDSVFAESCIQQSIETRYGQVTTYRGLGPYEGVTFLPRHGENRSQPPHRVNYRGNIWALYEAGVRHILALSVVGSLNTAIEPGSIVAVDQMIDWTHGREHTFFTGGEEGVAACDMTEPYCESLRSAIVKSPAGQNLGVHDGGTYVVFNGPRLETAAEIRMFSEMGGDVIGMTSSPECVLARELGMHYGAICTCINFGAGLVGDRSLKTDRSTQKRNQQALVNLAIDVLREGPTDGCACETSARVHRQPSSFRLRDG